MEERECRLKLLQVVVTATSLGGFKRGLDNFLEAAKSDDCSDLCVQRLAAHGGETGCRVR